MASLPYQDVQLKRSGMNVPRCVCSASALSCSALLTRPRVWCRAITNFIAGRPPHKSNFYCHPGRAGGNSQLISAGWHRTGGFPSGENRWTFSSAKCRHRALRLTTLTPVERCAIVKRPSSAAAGGTRCTLQQGKARALLGSVADHKEIVDFAQRVKKGQMIAGARYRDHWSQYGWVYRAKVKFVTLSFDPPSVFGGQAINCRKIRRRQEVRWRPLRVCSLHRSASTFLDSESLRRYLAKVISHQNGSDLG